jgi:ATP-dependent helicase/nuclease subunit B
VIVGGGKVLQPLLYAMAAQEILKIPVESGRLYYCTAAGGYEERVVRLDDTSRAALARVVKTIGDALAEGFLPAAPGDGECRWCDYRRVCGPYEEDRIRRKRAQELKPLAKLREMP